MERSYKTLVQVVFIFIKIIHSKRLAWPEYAYDLFATRILLNYLHL